MVTGIELRLAESPVLALQTLEIQRFKINKSDYLEDTWSGLSEGRTKEFR